MDLMSLYKLESRVQLGNHHHWHGQYADCLVGFNIVFGAFMINHKSSGIIYDDCHHFEKLINASLYIREFISSYI